MSNYRRTTAKNLQQVINDHLTSVADIQAEDKETGQITSFTAEQFSKDLDNYVSAGVSPNHLTLDTTSKTADIYSSELVRCHCIVTTALLPLSAYPMTLPWSR